MVNGPRRDRSAYSLNQRHFGKTSLERNAQYTIVEIVTRIAARLHLVQMHNRQRVFQVIQGLIQQYRHIDRFIITTEYNRRFLAKYQRVHGFPCSPRFSRTALFTDGTKVQINRGQQINYSGHKHCYCYSFLMTTAMDGMIVDAYGPRVGSDNDLTVYPCSAHIRPITVANNRGFIALNNGIRTKIVGVCEIR